jgi:predicted DNA binding protein
VVEAAADLAGLGEVAHLADRDDGALFEAVVTGRTVPGTVTGLGAVLTGAVAGADAVTVTLAAAGGVDVRGLIETLRETYPGTELLARRTREEPIEAVGGFRERVEDRLTDRQLEVLQAAHFGGYYRWPRERNAADLASGLGIAQSTFGRHLRAAERKLLSMLFDEDD